MCLAPFSTLDCSILCFFLSYFATFHNPHSISSRSSGVTPMMNILATMSYTLLVPLTPDQLETRRTQLNQAGHLAWCGPAVAYYILRPTIQLLSAAAPTSFQKPLRRLSWLLNTPLSSEFGTLQTHLLALVYTGYLLFLIFRDTGNDYMHLTKAFGHVAVSQLPWQYALAVKSQWNPLQGMLGRSHEDLNEVHRIFGRIVHLLLAVHAVMYLNFFVRINVLETKLKDPVVRLGIFAFWSFNFLALLSIPFIRRKFYHKMFYRSHVLLTAIILPVLYFHVPYTRKYILQAGAFYLFNGFARGLASSPAVSVGVEAIEGTSLLRLKADGKASAFLSGWTAGQHIYLKQSNSPVNPKTPFTVVAWPGSLGNRSEKASIDFVVRNLGGPQTSWLGGKNEANLLLEGPYGESKSYLPKLLKERTDNPVLLVAGGVGVTYTLPIYLALLDNYRSTTGITFVWFVKSIAEVAWVVEILGNAPCNVDVAIYITGNEPSGKSTDLGGVKNGIQVYSPQEREHVANIVGGVLEQDDERVYVFACGPSSMAKALRKELGFHVMRDGRDIIYHEEQFGLGSS
jgi:NAD(P)H-flavin reductase